MNKFLGVLGVFSGIWETKNGKSEIYFGFEGLQGLPLWLSIWGGGGVHWEGFEAQDLPEVALVLWSCVPAFLSAFSLCLWCVMLEYGSISRFKGVFRGFYMFGVGLYYLGALRGLWGFCTRVELGGFGARGVFAFVFLLLSLCLLSFYALCLLCSGCLSLSSCLVFTFLICLCYFFFPCGICAKKRAQRFCSLRPLFVCCGLFISL